jgi:hypothetical protein
MPTLKTRLKRLEAAMVNTRRHVSFWDVWGKIPDGFDPDRDLNPRHRSLWNTIVTLPAWLREHGYSDALTALEAGESGPTGLHELLREQAEYEHTHRAWARIEKALDAGQLPDDADLRAIRC